MGLASSIGLGVAISRPNQQTIIIDGDGNVLMSMGTLTMIAAAAPKNLLHIVIDNEVYESTGSQGSLSNLVALEKVAQSAGYAQAKKITTKDQVKHAFQELVEKDGPSFLLIKVEPSFDKSTGRVHHTPEEITSRFMKSLATTKNWPQFSNYIFFEKNEKNTPVSILWDRVRHDKIDLVALDMY